MEHIAFAYKVNIRMKKNELRELQDRYIGYVCIYECVKLR